MIRYNPGRNKKYIVHYRCRLCGMDFEDAFTNIHKLCACSNIQHELHTKECKMKVSEDEKILIDVVSYRPNPEYKEENEIQM